MDRSLVGTLLLGVVFIPYIVEVALQLWQQARFLAALPDTARSSLPPHPPHPWLAVLGSLRFQLALWRYIRHLDADEPDSIAALKRRMRTSLRRELVWAVGGLAVLSTLVASGWRPPWP